MFYLIECEDSSFCVIPKKLIVSDENIDDNLFDDCDVEFFWPANDEKSSKYKGTIIQSSTHESILLTLMKKMVKDKSRKTTVKKQTNANAEKKNEKKHNLKRKADSEKSEERLTKLGRSTDTLATPELAKSAKESRICEPPTSSSASQTEIRTFDKYTQTSIASDLNTTPPNNSMSSETLTTIENTISSIEKFMLTIKKIINPLKELANEIRNDENVSTKNITAILTDCAGTNDRSTPNSPLPGRNGQNDKENSFQDDNGDSMADEDLKNKWTLRYPTKSSENVIELIHGTGIFVNKHSLKNAKILSKNQTHFARALLELIFTQEALTKCTLSGKMKNRMKNASDHSTGEDGRPALHAGAKLVMMNFLREFYKEETLNEHKVLASLRSKLQEMKVKTKH